MVGVPRSRPSARQLLNQSQESSLLPLLNDSIVSIPLSSRLRKDRPTPTAHLEDESFPLKPTGSLSAQ